MSARAGHRRANNRSAIAEGPGSKSDKTTESIKTFSAAGAAGIRYLHKSLLVVEDFPCTIPEKTHGGIPFLG